MNTKEEALKWLQGGRNLNEGIQLYYKIGLNKPIKKLLNAITHATKKMQVLESEFVKLAELSEDDLELLEQQRSGNFAATLDKLGDKKKAETKEENGKVVIKGTTKVDVENSDSETSEKDGPADDSKEESSKPKKQTTAKKPVKKKGRHSK